MTIASAHAPIAAPNEWAHIAAAAPQLASTMTRYLDQATTFLAPRSVEAAELALRKLAGWLVDHTDRTSVVAITRTDVEDFKIWLADQPGQRGPKLSANSQRQRLRMLRVFFERIIEWDWPDAPLRNPIIGRDIPPRPEPLPKFLDDRDAAKLMAAARAATDGRDRLALELLARTGMRAGELCGLDADAVVQIGDGHWLRIPVGKLRNDRYVPLHPELVALLAEWTAANIEHIRTHRRLIADHRGVINRHILTRILNRLARRAGIGHVHPHQLRHTLATQAGFNAGVSLQALMALLGHVSAEMSLRYARLFDTTVRAEYERALDLAKTRLGPLPSGRARIPVASDDDWREAPAIKARLAGGYCLRAPAQGACPYANICEHCPSFRTDAASRAVLATQRVDAEALAADAEAHGWGDEADRHRRLVARLDALIAEADTA